MTYSTLHRILLCIVLSFGFIAPGFAKAKKSPPPTPHEIVISSISGNTITITDDKTAKTVTVTQFTEITVNGQKATFADLKPGMGVNLTLNGPTQASRITATTTK
jgi:hypothetical protein